MHDVPGLLAEIRGIIGAHARPDMRTSIDGLLVSRVETQEPDHSLTDPLLVVMAQGGKRLLLGDRVFEYRAGQCLVVTTGLPVTGHFIAATRETPSLAMGLVLRPAVIAALLLDAPGSVDSSRAGSAHTPGPATGAALPAMGTCDAGPELLDAAARMLRLLDHPGDAHVLAPMIEREILWRLITGPHGGMIRQIGLADSHLSHVSRAIRWIRDNYAEPMRVEDLSRMAGMSTPSFHRHFRAVTTMSPLQFQKRIRLQEARSLLVAGPDAAGPGAGGGPSTRGGPGGGGVTDVAGVGHLVGYDSPSQFSREYRRLFGIPPGQDATRLRAFATSEPVHHLP